MKATPLALVALILPTATLTLTLVIRTYSPVQMHD